MGPRDRSADEGGPSGVKGRRSGGEGRPSADERGPSGEEEKRSGDGPGRVSSVDPPPHRAGALNYEAGYTKPVFHWSFDGGARNNYRYRGVFDGLDLTPTLAISPARLADDGKLSWDELRELQTEHGWGVSNHGHRHDRFDELAPAEQEREVLDAVEAFRDHGVAHRHYVYSWGMAGGATGRSVVANYYPYAWGTVHAPETAGIAGVESPYALPRTFVENASDAELEAAVDRAIENETGMVLFGHNVVRDESVDPDGFETDVETIERLTRYVRERGGEWVDDLSAVVRYAKTPVRVGGGPEPVRVDDLSAGTVGADDISAGTVRADRVDRSDVAATAFQTADQRVPPGTTTAVSFDEGGFDHGVSDPAAGHETSGRATAEREAFDTSAAGLTVPRSGTYHLLGTVHLRTDGAGTLELRAVHGGAVEAVTADTDARGGVHSRRVATHLELDAGETVGLAVEHDTGAAARTCAGRERVRLDLARLG